MAQPIQWRGTVPAGADADVQYLLGAIPEGMKLIVSACSVYGGDAGEKYSVNAVPPGPNPNGLPVDGSIGQVQWLYAIPGGVQTLSDPVNIISALVNVPNPMPGPCTLTLATTSANAAELVVTLMGYLEAL